MSEMEKVCPRCGGLYSYIERRVIGGKVYYYVVHERVVNGRRSRSRCYLGPDVYTYVSHTHTREGLVFQGLASEARALAYLDALIAYIREIDLDPNTARKLAGKFRALVEELEKYAREEGGEDKGGDH